MRSVPIPDELDFGEINMENRAPAAYQQIIAHVLRLVDNGHLQPGDPFPSGTRLATHYDVSYFTIRHAIELLQARGVLVAEQGRQTRVHSEYRPPARQTELLPDLT